MNYNKNDIRNTVDGIKYYKHKIYPIIPYSIDDIYIIANAGDRLDLLSNQYYKDTKYWWIIYNANNSIIKGSLFIQPGTQIRIPTNINGILQEFERLNANK